MKKQGRNLIAAGIIGLFTFCTVYFGWFTNAELLLQDAVYQKQGRADPSIKIVAIDEKTLHALGQFENWTRKYYADLIRILNQKGNEPAVIGFDILMVNEKGAEDALLVDACKEHDNIVMAQNLVFATKLERADGKTKVDSMHIELVEMPFGQLPEYVGMGFANTVQDVRDNKVRYTMLQVEEHESFASAIVQRAKQNRGEQAVSPTAYMPIDSNNGFLIDYIGGAGTYETISMIDVLEGKIPPEAFADSIVLVGAHAAGMGDAYEVPSAKGGQMYGVEIHANIIQTLLEKRALVMATPWICAVGLGILAFGLTLLVSHLKIWMSGVLLAVGLFVQYLIGLKLDEEGIVISMLGLPLSLVLVVLWSIISKYMTEALQKRKIMHAFQKYVAPQVVEEISKNQDYQLKLGGEKRHIAVLFVDIRGFTPLSESLEPEQVVEILNEYLGLVTKAIFQNDGTLDKFIGDAAMAVFNAPFDNEDYIYKAVCAARDIAAGSEQIADKFMERFGKTVSYGIGVNCGDAVVGNIGSDFRMDYTAIGDTVNTAARLESNAKAGQILISEYVYDKVKERVKVTEIGEIPLKGKSKGVMVYAVDQVL